MNSDDPRTKFSINSFNTVNLGDLYSWGQTYDIATLADQYGPGTTIQLGGPQYVLDRNATAPTEWTISCLRYIDNGAYSGNFIAPAGNPDAIITEIDLSILTGSGAASKQWNPQNDQNSPAFPPSLAVNTIPAAGAAYHVVAESCRVNLTIQTNPTANQASVEKFHCWIARGRPAQYNVQLAGFYLPIPPYNQWGGQTYPVTVPDFCVSVNVVGVNQATKIQNDVRVYFFAEQPLTPTAAIPTPIAIRQLLATDVSNQILIPAKTRTILVTGPAGFAPGPPIESFLNFNCVS